MSLYRRCDRCRSDGPASGVGWKVVTMTELLAGLVTVAANPRGTELCGQCVDQLTEWLAPIPQPGPAQ